MTEEIRLTEGVMAEEIRVVEHYSASILNKVGEGARVLGALRDAGVNLIAFWGYKHGARPRAARIHSRRQRDVRCRRQASQAQAAQEYGALYSRRRPPRCHRRYPYETCWGTHQCGCVQGGLRWRGRLWHSRVPSTNCYSQGCGRPECRVVLLGFHFSNSVGDDSAKSPSCEKHRAESSPCP